MSRLFIIISLAILLARCNQIGEWKHSKGIEKPKVNFYAANFQLPDSTGTYRDFYRHLSQANILDFWASWCRPCRESANPYYQKLYIKYHKRGLNIFGVSGDRHQYFWKQALEQDRIPWINTIDSTHLIYKRFEIKSIPKMFLIDSKGKIIGINLWGENLEKKIDSMLAETN